MKKILILAFLFAIQLHFAYAVDPRLIGVPVDKEVGAKADFEVIQPYMDKITPTYYPCYDDDPTDDCGKWSDWFPTYAIICLPDFPDCPINVKYQTRICSSGEQTEYLITHIAIPSTDECQALNDYLNDASLSSAQKSKLQVQLRHDLYVELGKDDFTSFNDYLVSSGECPLYCNIPAGSSCNQPQYNHKKILYIESNCLGSCHALFSSPNSDGKWYLMLARACDITNCCKCINEFCIDYKTNELVRTETKIPIGTGSTCNSYPDLDACTEMMWIIPGLLDVWTTECVPTCN